MPNNNDPLNKWEDTVAQQADREYDRFQRSHDDTSQTLERNKQELETQKDNQEKDVSDYMSTYTYNR